MKKYTITLNEKNFFQKDKKDARQDVAGTKDELLIDETVLKDCKKTQQSIHRVDRLHRSIWPCSI